jgi:hypothetical protein
VGRTMTWEWRNDPGYVELAEEMYAGYPDDFWDGDYGDDGQEQIIVNYVHHLRDEVIRLGGTVYAPWVIPPIRTSRMVKSAAAASGVRKMDQSRRN